MRGMNLPRFSTSTLLLSITVAAIVCAGMMTIAEGHRGVSMMPAYFAILSPVIVPWVFIGYAIGCKALTVRMVIALAGAQALAIGIALLIFRLFP